MEVRGREAREGEGRVTLHAPPSTHPLPTQPQTYTCLQFPRFGIEMNLKGIFFRLLDPTPPHSTLPRPHLSVRTDFPDLEGSRRLARPRGLGGKLGECTISLSILPALSVWQRGDGEEKSPRAHWRGVRTLHTDLPALQPDRYPAFCGPTSPP